MPHSFLSLSFPFWITFYNYLFLYYYYYYFIMKVVHIFAEPAISFSIVQVFLYCYCNVLLQDVSYHSVDPFMITVVIHPWHLWVVINTLSLKMTSVYNIMRLWQFFVIFFHSQMSRMYVVPQLSWNGLCVMARA